MCGLSGESHLLSARRDLMAAHMEKRSHAKFDMAALIPLKKRPPSHFGQRREAAPSPEACLCEEGKMRILPGRKGE